ncbi:MAG: Ig-like domain-containing protein, partial [Rickettsiales bacterium]|nr:Ig-like domain-containing protein [Rickettsiales bacterium]
NNFSGTDTFHYTINDGNGGTDTAKVTVTVTHVNVNPDAQNDNVDAYENVPVSINVLANDTDGDGDSLTIASVTNGNNGTAEIVNGLVLYTPNQGFSGTDTFTYTVNDGNGGTDTATVTVDVCPNPDMHFSDAFTIGLGEDFVFASDDPLFSTEDFKSDENYLIGVDLETIGSPHNVSIDQSLLDNGSVVIHKGANGTNSLWFKGKGDDILAALQTLKFTSSSNDSTNETIVACAFREIPGEGFKHVDINYIDAIINSSVAANDDTLKAFEDTPLTINPDDLLANDDGNGSIVSFTQPSNGTITEDVNGNLVYTPKPDFNGTDTFTYTISTGQGNYSNNLIINGSFEADNVSDHNGAWEVYPNGITGWQTDIGAGIEIQTGNTGGIGATDGNQKVELDSHFADDTNSNMYQDVDVSNANDELLLQFDYSARNYGDTAASSVIEVYWDGELLDTITAAASGWKTYSYNVSTVGKDTARLEFRADGTDDTYGGLIDNVKLLDSNPSTSTATVTIEVCPVNDAPVAGDDSITTAEDTPVLIDVLNNDDDIDGDTLTIVSVTDGQNGTVVIENGQVKYTPYADFVGTDTFTYTVEDGNGGTDTATVTVEVTPVNDAPVANTDNVTTNEDTPVVIDVLANDDDVDGDTLTIVSVTDGQNGTVVIESGQVKYTPNADFNGNDSFTYTITDGNGETSTGTVNVTVNPINDAPLAEDDTVTTDEDTPITIDVLSNDDDVDGDALTITSVSNPASGIAQIVNGQIKYTPNNNFNGTDTFTYTVSDGNGGTDTATVTVNVDSLNDAPVALDDVVATYEDTAVAINVLINDTDADSDALTITDVTDGANGTVVIENGQVKYTPNADFNGVDTFTYTISDGKGGTSTATVTVHVCPVADNLQAHDDSYTANDGDNLTSELITGEDTPLDIQVSDLLENDEGVHLLPASAKVIIESTPANGTLYLVDGQNMTQLNNGDMVGTNATIRFVPNQGVDGIDNFQYSIHVPYEAFDSLADYQTPTLGSPNGNGMDAVVVTDPGEHEVSVSFVSKSAGFNNTLGYYIYDCDGNIVETDVIWSKISGSQPDSVIGNLAEGHFLGFFLAADGGDTGLNDASEIRFVDANGQPANYNGAVAGQSQFNLQYKDSNDNWVDFNAGADKGVFHSNAAELNPNGLEHVVTGKVDVNGQSKLQVTFEDLYVNSDWDANDLTFLVNVADQTSNVANVTINVENTNDAPVANKDNATTLEDVAILIDVLDNDTDADGDTLTITSVTNGTNGTVVIENGQVKYTPNANFYGQDSFTYTIDDGNGETSTGTVKVNVLPINDAPVANPDNVTTDEDTPVEIDVLANDTDIEGDTLTLQSVSHGSHGTVTIVNGKAVYTPDADFVGTDTFTYAVSDGNSGLATGTVTVTVNPVNDAPVALDDVATTDEEIPVVIDVLANDEDADGDTLSIVSVTDGSNGTVVIENGQVKYTPNADFNGVDTFTYTITDGTETHTGTVTVTVNPVNDAPVALDDFAITDEDVPVTIDVLANDFDVDGDTIQIDFVTNGNNGTTQVVNGEVIYTPNPNFFGTDTFTTYVITDGQGGFAQANVEVTVLPVNDNPVAVDDSAFTSENTAVSVDVVDNDTDIEGDTLSLQSVTNGANGTVAIVNGEAVYTPNQGFSGTDTFTYVVSDGNGGTDTGTVTVEVVSSEEAPIARPDSATTVQGQSITINVLANDNDVDGTIVDVIPVNQPSHGTITVNPNGSIVYNPNGGFSGTDTFTYRVIDNDNNTSLPALVTVTVKPLTLPDFGPGTNDEDDSDGTPETSNNSLNPGKLGDIGSYDPYGKISNFDYSDYALRLVFELPDVVKKSEGSQTFGIPRASFEHRDDKEIKFEALMADGSDLPAWMEFDADKGEFKISPPDLPNENFEILVTAKDDEGNEAESTFTLILLDENNIAFLEEENGENEEDEDISENSTPVDAAFEALLKEFNEFTKHEFNDGFVPFSKQLNNNLKTELDSRALELIKNMYAA